MQSKLEQQQKNSRGKSGRFALSTHSRTRQERRGTCVVHYRLVLSYSVLLLLLWNYFW
jgi:hypothetical protein